MFKHIILFLLISLPLSAYAEPSKDIQDKIRKINNYFSDLTTLEAEFVQTSNDSTDSQGKIYISRPGKAYWEYNTPFQSALVVNGEKLMYWDKDLNQVTYGDVPQNSLRVLLDKNANFSDKAKFFSINEENKIITLAVRSIPDEDSEDNEKEILFLKFNYEPVNLKEITKINNTGSIQIELKEVKLNKRLDEKLFSLKNPKSLKRR